jgi:hypothetical protein
VIIIFLVRRSLRRPGDFSQVARREEVMIGIAEVPDPGKIFPEMSNERAG